RLEQRGLRARRGAVDLVREDEVREDRARLEAEPVAAVRGLLQDARADDVRRHEVRRELDALEGEVEGRRQGLDQRRLADARSALGEGVPLGEQREEQELGGLLLAQEAVGELASQALRALAKGRQAGFELGG